MANHSRDEIDTAKKVQDVGTAGAVGVGALLLGLLGKSMVDRRNNEKAHNEIIRINNRIESLRGEFLGDLINADEIARLRVERDEWQKKLK